MIKVRVVQSGMTFPLESGKLLNEIMQTFVSTSANIGGQSENVSEKIKIVT